MMRQKRRTNPKRQNNIWLPVLIIISGLAVLLYPVLSTQWNNAVQQKVIQEYRAITSKPESRELLNTQLLDAQEYNLKTAKGPILDPWLSRVSKDNEDYQNYLKHLAAFPAMGRIIVPDSKVDLPIYHGTGEDTLQKGVGHLFGTDLPVGGTNTHTVLTGHTGLTNSTMFDNLIDLEVGDKIYIDAAGQRIKYQIHETSVVLPNETENLGKVENEDLLTLITCTPYGINSHRLLIHAHRVPMDPAVDNAVFEQTLGSIWQWWMIVFVGIALLVVMLLILWILKQTKKTKINVLILVLSLSSMAVPWQALAQQTGTQTLSQAVGETTLVPFKNVTGDVEELKISDIDKNRLASLTIRKPLGNPYDENATTRPTVAGIEVNVGAVTGIDLTTTDGWKNVLTLTVEQAQQKLGKKYTATTNEKGEAYFENLPIGVYLIWENPRALNGVKQTITAPFILTLPVGDKQAKIWRYAVTVTTKSADPQKPKPPAPEPPLPQPPIPPAAPPAKPPKIPSMPITGTTIGGVTAIAIGALILGVMLKVRGRQQREEN